MEMIGQVKNRVMFWFGASRAPFFVAVITPTFLGTAIAWATKGVFHWGYFLLALIGAMCVNGGTNLFNDYFDRKTDEINVDYVFPFTGGSRMIQKGLLEPSRVLKAGIICFIIATLIGAYLVWARGLMILVLGAIGVGCGLFYTAPPVKLGYRWIGEFVVGVNCGILVTLGAYYVQTQSLAWQPLVAAIPLGLLIAAVLWVNEIPDYIADKSVGKNQLVVRLGRKRAATGYVVLLAIAYIMNIVGVILGWVTPEIGIPLLALLALITLPLGIRNMRLAIKKYDEPASLAPANATTPLLYLSVGLLLCLGFILDKLMLG